MDAPSPTPQWAILPQDAQDTSEDSGLDDDQLSPSPRDNPKLAPAPRSKRFRESLPSEMQGRSPKRLKQTTEQKTPRRDFGASSSNVGSTRPGPGSSRAGAMSHHLSRSATEKGPQAFNETPKQGKSLNASMPNLLTQARAESSRSGANMKEIVPETESSNSSGDGDDPPPLARQVAKKSTRGQGQPPPKKPTSKPPSPTITVISISSDSKSSRSSEPAAIPLTQHARKRTMPKPPPRKSVQVPIPVSPKKPSLESASAPASPTSPWKALSETWGKLGKNKGTASTSELPGASKSASSSKFKSKVGPKAPNSTLDSFVQRRERGTVDRRPLAEALGIEPFPKKLGKKPGTADREGLAAAIEEAAAQNSRVGMIQQMVQRKGMRPASYTPPVGESASASGATKDFAIDLTLDSDENDAVSAPPLPRRKRSRPKPPSILAPKPEPTSPPSHPPTNVPLVPPETPPKPDVTRGVTPTGAPHSQKQPPTPVRRHTMPMGSVLASMNDVEMSPITRIAAPADIGPSSVPPTSPVSSDSSKALSPLFPNRSSLDEMAPLATTGKTTAKSAENLFLEDDSEGMADANSDTSGAMEVDAILGSSTRDPSSELEDLTEAMGTQKLKTSSPANAPATDDTVPVEVAAIIRLPSSPAASDGFADFYASEEDVGVAPVPEAPAPMALSNSASSPSSSPCRTPKDNEALPVVVTAGGSTTKSYGGISALNFDSWRDHYKADVKYTSDLPSILHDHINSYTEQFRMSKDMRAVLQASIAYNTMEDEPHAPPIEILNNVDDEATPPWEFYYTNQLYHGPGVPPPDTANLKGCDCVGRCDPRSKTCSCAARQKVHMDPVDQASGWGFVYDKNRKLKTRGIPIIECNDMCGCDADCGNRIVQHGRTVQLSIQKTEKKGWGVFAGPKKIPTGTFLGVYSGELLTDVDSHQRGVIYDASDRTYLFDLDFYYLSNEDADWGSKYTVDAYHAGNFTRFLNHSCEPNCRIYGCYINEANMDKPLLVCFTTSDIEAYQEICFNYMGIGYEEDYDPDAPPEAVEEVIKRVDAVYKPCQCGARSCTGKMF